jgi:hypothetical protein
MKHLIFRGAIRVNRLHTFSIHKSYLVFPDDSLIILSSDCGPDLR